MAVAGADIPGWPGAPKVATLGPAVPEAFDLRVGNGDDIAVIRLATPQSRTTVALAGRGLGGPGSQQVIDEEAACGTDVF